MLSATAVEQHSLKPRAFPAALSEISRGKPRPHRGRKITMAKRSAVAEAPSERRVSIMINRKIGLLLGGAITLALAVPAFAGYWSTLPDAAAPATTFTVPMDTNYAQGRQPQTVKATLANIGSATMQNAGSGGWRNALVGGDFGTNLWQRGTTSASITTAALYTADRWAGLSGTGTAFTVIKETAAADITNGYAASARVQRTASQTGVLPVCLAQVLTSANSTRFQGGTAEFSFHALAGANFSPAGSAITASIFYGTGTDQSAATGLAGTWTGQANAASAAVTLTTSWDRYSVVGVVPVTATQVGVQICYTPVGTAGANDWFEFTGAQLDINPGAVARTDGTIVPGKYSIASVERRPQSIESELQYAYFYRLSEPASGAAIPAMCQATGATANICNVFLPVVMRATTPTIVITTAGTFKVNIAGTPTTIASPVASTCSSNSCAVTAGNTNTNGQAELLSGGGGTGAWDISAEL